MKILHKIIYEAESRSITSLLQVSKVL